LAKYGIPTVVDLPAVGLNLQEQTLVSMGAKGTNFNPGGSGPSDIIAFPNIYQVRCAQLIIIIGSRVHVWIFLARPISCSVREQVRL
jgi:hypothetical protein